MTLTRSAVVTATGLLLYTASYAPFLRYKFAADLPLPEPEPNVWYCCVDESFLVRTHTFYRPIEIIIDHTPFKKLFLKWGNLWNVEDRLEREHQMREFDHLFDEAIS